MNKLKIAFFGAPLFAARVLEKIIMDTDLPVELTFVVTQPDKKAGRKQILTPTPVKTLAIKCNIAVFDSSQSTVISQQLKQVDLVLLYAYGEILPAEILKIPKWGFWNIHPSLLPKYRGTSPIAYTLLMGDKTTGVSLMEMDERMDHGPIIAQQTYEIQNEDSREILENKLSDIGYELFKKSVQDLIDGTLQKHEQNHDKRTFTRLLTKQDGFLPFTLVQKILTGASLENEDLPKIITDYYVKNHLPVPNYELHTTHYALFKALAPWPGLWTLLPDGRRFKLTRMELRTTHYALRTFITHVQLEGKKEISLATFLAGHPGIL